ncbi:MAG: ABC1 kinase family protein [Lysobacteraceae bacterium]
MGADAVHARGDTVSGRLPATRPPHPGNTRRSPMSHSEGIARYADIATLILKYRKAGVFSGLDIDENVLADAGPKARIPEGTPEAFASDLEALGPTFIKLGQSLSTRPDLVPEPYLDALERMQDDVSPLDYTDVAEVIEDELGVRISKLFESFEREPLASASLAQVHAATLRGGRRVAVKVQRPGILDTIRSDLDMLARLAGTIDRVSDIGRRYHFAEWVREFRKTLLGELDYRLEADNLELFAENLVDHPGIQVPQPVRDLSTARVLTMDLLPGTKVTRVPGVARTELDLCGCARTLMRAYLDQVFVHGLIHADPHPGNVLLLDGGRIALLDLGMVANVPPRLRDRLLKFLLAAIDGRGEEAADIFIEMGTRLEDFEEANFVRETSRLVAQYLGHARSSAISEGRLIMELARMAAAHGLRTPPELTLLGKTLLNLEAVSAALDPDMDVRSVVEAHLNAVMRKRILRSFSPSQLASEMLEVQDLVRQAPKRASTILQTLAENRFRVHLAGLEESHLMEALQHIANRIAAGAVIAALILGAALMMGVETESTLFGYPAAAMVLLIIAAIFGVILLVSTLLTDRKAKPFEDHGPR